MPTTALHAKLLALCHTSYLHLCSLHLVQSCSWQALTRPAASSSSTAWWVAQGCLQGLRSGLHAPLALGCCLHAPATCASCSPTEDALPGQLASAVCKCPMCIYMHLHTHAHTHARTHTQHTTHTRTHTHTMPVSMHAHRLRRRSTWPRRLCPACVRCHRHPAVALPTSGSSRPSKPTPRS